MKDIQFNEWIPWNINNFNQYKSDRLGIGNGEKKIVWELEAVLMGSKSCFDILTIDGRKWEVKAVARSIRTGVEGIKHTASSIKIISDIVYQIQDAFGSIDDDIACDIFDISALNIIRAFIKVDIPKIVDSGEISKGRIFGSCMQKIGLLDIMLAIKKLKDIYDVKEYDQNKEKFIIKLNDKNYETSPAKFVQVAVTLGVSKDEYTNILHKIDSKALFFSSFDHVGFIDPKSFITNIWKSMGCASKVFSAIDGIIFVKPNAYKIVPTHMLDDFLIFTGTTQCGKPKYRIKK